MRKLFLAASAAAMAFSMPAVAEAQGKGKGNGVSARAQQTATVKRNARSNGQVRTDVRARTDARANARARTRTGAAIDRRLDTNANGIPDYREARLADVNNNGIPDARERRMVDLNGNGIADYRERLIDLNRDGIDDRAQNRYGGNVCPPGLAKKTPACIPPGQARRMFNVGQRVPTGFNRYTGLNDIPVDYRDDIPDIYRTDQYRYIYRDNRVYVVDRTTRIVRSIIDLIAR